MQVAVPRFEPFAAVRYDSERVALADVVAPPYDVIGPDERARLEARSPYNAVHVDLAREDARDGDPYDAARCRFEEWLAEGVLRVDPEPAFYVYRMGWRGADGRPRQTSGVLGALELDADRTGAVLPHERTMPRPLGDRLRLIQACRANLSPIWMLSLARGVSAALQPDGPPIARCTDEDGVHHRLWRITAPAALDAVASTVASAPLVIADGHHRYETALAYRGERRAANGGRGSPADLVLAYVVELADEELDVRSIHRLLAGLPPRFSLLDALSSSFALEPIGPQNDDVVARWAAADALAVVSRHEAFLLRPRAHAVGLTDSERLEEALVAVPEHETAYHHDPATALALVDKGEAQAAFLVRAPTVAQIAAAARDGRRLPQKTTFFRPKPRTGLVFRLLDR